MSIFSLASNPTYSNSGFQNGPIILKVSADLNPMSVGKAPAYNLCVMSNISRQQPVNQVDKQRCISFPMSVPSISCRDAGIDPNVCPIAFEIRDNCIKDGMIGQGSCHRQCGSGNVMNGATSQS